MDNFWIIFNGYLPEYRYNALRKKAAEANTLRAMSFSSAQLDSIDALVARMNTETHSTIFDEIRDKNDEAKILDNLADIAKIIYDPAGYQFSAVIDISKIFSYQAFTEVSAKVNQKLAQLRITLSM